jgi:hypothetical protein
MTPESSNKKHHREKEIMHNMILNVFATNIASNYEVNLLEMKKKISQCTLCFETSSALFQ